MGPWPYDPTPSAPSGPDVYSRVAVRTGGWDSVLGKVTQGPSWGYSKVNVTRFFGRRGHFLPKVDKSGQTAPRTGTGYPHEGPFVGDAGLMAAFRPR